MRKAIAFLLSFLLLTISPNILLSQGDGDSWPLENAYHWKPYAPWPMFQHDPFHTGLSQYRGPQTNRTKWVSKICGLVRFETSPVIGRDGTIYVACHQGPLVAVNPDDGSIKWKYRFPFPEELTTSPAIGRDGTIYVAVTTDENNGYLYALNPDGTLKFKKEMKAADVYSHITISFYGDVILGSGKCSSKRAYLFRFSPDGREVLAFKTFREFRGDDYFCQCEGFVISSPVSDRSGYIFFNDNKCDIRALTADGRLSWESWDPLHYFQHFSPSIGPDGTIYVLTLSSGHRPHEYVGELFAFNRFDKSGKPLWKAILPEHYYAAQDPLRVFGRSLAIGPDGTIYVPVKSGYGGYGGGLVAFTPTGSVKWKFNAPVKAPSSYKPYKATSLSPVVGSDGTVYFAVMYGYVFAVTPEGRLKWMYKVGQLVESSLAIGPDGALYVADFDGKLHAIKDAQTLITGTPLFPTLTSIRQTSTSTQTLTSATLVLPTLTQTSTSATTSETTSVGQPQASPSVTSPTQTQETTATTGSTLTVTPKILEVTAGDTAWFNITTSLSSPIIRVENLPTGYRYVITKGEGVYFLRIFTHPYSYGRFDISVIAESGGVELSESVRLIVKERRITQTMSNQTTQETSQIETQSSSIPTATETTQEEKQETRSPQSTQVTTVTQVVVVKREEGGNFAVILIALIAALLIAALLLKRRG